MRRGLVLGCGGTVGGAWQVGALVALQAALDWDPRTAEVVVGTSSGATLATMLRAGVDVDELLAGQRDRPDARPAVRRFFAAPPAALPGLPLGVPALGLAVCGLSRRERLVVLAGLAPRGHTDAGFLDALVDDLVPGGGWVDQPTWIVAADARTGRRVAFGSTDAPSATMRDAVRASWAVPGWYPPVAIAGRDHLDGGIASPTSADLLAPLSLDEVVIVAPMASAGGDRVGGFGGRIEAVMRNPMSRIVDGEAALLQAAGTRVVRVHPGRDELAAMGSNFMDPSRRLPALEAALAHVPPRLDGAATSDDRLRTASQGVQS